MEKNASLPPSLQTATFAGGCFWCLEHAFAEIPGVHEVVSGFSGGKEKHPTYEQVSSGGTGYVEAIQLRYNPAEISYGDLLDLFWSQIDPVDAGGQFADRGRQYTTAIFYHDEEQRRLAEASKAALAASRNDGKPIATAIRSFTSFERAEEEHQRYAEKEPLRYRFYHDHSGREPLSEKS